MSGKVIHTWKKVFLHHIESGRPQQLALTYANVSNSQLIQAKKLDPDFANRIEEFQKKPRSVIKY